MPLWLYQIGQVPDRSHHINYVARWTLETSEETPAYWPVIVVVFHFDKGILIVVIDLE